MRRTTVFFAISLWFVVAAPTAGAQCGTRVGEWAYGPSYAAAGDGELAVFGVGRMLQVADVSNPTLPVVLGSLEVATTPRGVVIDGDTAFVAASDAGLLFVDISRPNRPELVAEFSNLDGVSDLAIVGQTAYVANQNGGLLILDVADPTEPEEIAQLDFDRTVVDVAVHGTTAYLANYDDGLQIVDVSDPAAPTLIGTLGDIDRVYNLDVSDDGGLVVVGNRYESLDRIIDVSDPTAPVQVGAIDLDYDYALDVTLDGSFAYVANRTNGLKIFDISVPSTPVQVRRIRTHGSTEKVMIHGSLAYLANYDGGLRVVDIGVPGEAEEVGFIPAFFDLKQAVMSGGLALAAAGNQIITFDVWDPSAPTEVATVPFSGYANAARIDGDLGYVAGDYRGLVVIDLADPAKPEVIGTAETCDAHDLEKEGDTVFVACRSDGLDVVDVSTPTDPRVIGGLDGFRGNHVAWADGVLYMPDYETGLHVIDVTDPTSPSHVSTVDIPSPGHPPKVHGDRLFVSTSRDGVVIFDITNPREPLEIGQILDTKFLFGTAPVGDVLFVASIYNGGYIHDVSDPSSPVRLATVDFAMNREGEVTSEGSLVMTTENDGGFEIFDLGPCFSEPPTADFTWRPGNPEAGRVVRLTDTSFGSITSRSWSFGDGATSAEHNPTHIWTAAGTYEVSLTVDGPMGSRTAVRTVTVDPASGGAPPITDPGEHAWVIAASAHAPGLEDTQWVTDIALHNPTSGPALAHLWFMKAGQSNTGAQGVGVTVAAGASVLIDDVVLSLFGENNAAGAILVGADQPLLVTSRTYNDAASGTYGQFIPGRKLDDAVVDGEAVWLIELTRTDEYRTNLGFANPTASSLDVAVSLRAADGSVIGNRTLTAPAFGYVQQTDILGADVGDAFAVVSASAAGASYFPFASVIDNRTGDPMMIEPIGPDDLHVIAATAHVGGYAGTDWRTDLEVCNPTASSLDCELRLLESGRHNGNPASISMSLAAGGCSRIEDVLDTSFAFEGTAALAIEASSGSFIASSRTFNTTDDGTFGQFLPGIPRGGALTPGGRARIIQLTQDVSDSSGFRTNLGFVNRSSTATTVDVELRGPAGSLLGTLAVQLKPFEHRQINRVFRQATSAPVHNGTVTVSTSTSGGAFVAYASTVDNASGDPIYIPAVPITP